MAISVSIVQDWVRASDASETTASGSFSVSAGDWVLAVGVGATTTDETEFAWTIGGASTAHTASISAAEGVVVCAALKKASSSGTWSVLAENYFFGAGDPAIKVYRITGADGTAPVGASLAAKGTTNVYQPSVTIQDAGSVLIGAGMTTTMGTPSTSLGGATVGSDYAGDPLISGYDYPGATGSYVVNWDAAGSGTTAWYVVEVEMKPAAATSHSAAASVAETATLTASATRTQFGAASVAETATLTASAYLTAVATASVAETVTITAAATVTSAGTMDAALSTTATVTASATREQAAAAAVSETVSVTAAADRSQFADAALSETVTVTASATVYTPTNHSASATLSVTAGFTAAGSILGEIPSTPGFMRGVEVVGPTIRPATGAASVPHIVALVDFDAATMRAHLSTSLTPSRYGLPLFAGGAVNPVEAGLLPAGSAYFWFTEDGELYHETGD